MEDSETALSIPDAVCKHGKDTAEHDGHLDQLMKLTHKHSHIIKLEKCNIKINDKLIHLF